MLDSVFRKRLAIWSGRSFALCFVLFLAGCANGSVSGPVQISLIQPIAGGHCQYQVVPTSVTTLSNINTLKGAVGQVVTTNSVLDSVPEILDSFKGLNPPDLDFGSSGGVYFPEDFQTLFNASLYQAVEETYLLTLAAGPQADLTVLNPNLSQTRIIYNAQLSIDDTGELTTDNAAYQAYPVTLPDGSAVVRDYLYAFPDHTVTLLPLGLNKGILGHESMHEWNRYAWMGKVDLTNTLTKNTIRSVDEGTADLAGFMISTDSNFFDCTFPIQGARDLAKRKMFDTNLSSNIATKKKGYPIHDAGAVWAYAQWKIGSAIGQRENLNALERMFLNFSSCARNDGEYDFNSIIQCHLRAIGSRSGAASSVYSDVFAGTFGG